MKKLLSWMSCFSFFFSTEFFVSGAMGYSPCPGETVSFSSPEFLKLLPEMDEKMVPIDHAKVSDEQKSPVDGF